MPSPSCKPRDNEETGRAKKACTDFMNAYNMDPTNPMYKLKAPPAGTDLSYICPVGSKNYVACSFKSVKN
jgi:hypothetical protein